MVAVAAIVLGIISIPKVISGHDNGSASESAPTFTVWHPYAPESPQGTALEALAAQFGQAHTKYKVETVYYDGVAVRDALLAPKQSDALPDVVYVDPPTGCRNWCGWKF